MAEIATPAQKIQFDNPVVSFLKKVLPASVKLATKARWRHGRISLNLPDRRFLEDVAIPYFREQENVEQVLDVGTDWYTWRYNTLFPGKKFHSIDFDPAKAKFASQNHVTGSILELDQYFEKNQFDLILCNGVFGWGVNSKSDIETAVAQFKKSLKPGGYLVVGWNDNDEHRPDGIEESLNEAFSPFVLPPVGNDFFDTSTAHRHLFRFYRANGVPEGAIS